MMIVGIALIVLFLADALRLRFRIGSLQTASADPRTEESGEVCFLTAQDITLSPEIRQRMIAHMNANGLDVLDAIPAQWHSLGALSLAQMVDPSTYRTARLGKGRTVGIALAVRTSVLQRAGYPTTDRVVEPADLAQAARRLKLYTCTTNDLAIIPGLRQHKLRLGQRKALLHEMIGGMTWVVLIGQPLVFCGLVTFAILSPLWGGIVLGLFHLQPIMTLAFGPIRAWDTTVQALSRVALEACYWVGTILGDGRAPEASDPVEDKRPRYTKWVENGLDDFFEEKRTSCPLCGDEQLKARIQTCDLVQRKPGRFTLDECGQCQHVFQNPRLSLAGLDYYYSDFYDGLGEAGLEAIFGHSAEPYWTRARMVEGHIEPALWLDVGAGHGHFCCTARDIFPNTRFDALDLSESVDEAARRGWADQGIRALFPEAATDMSSRYDVVSMSHYLEHTREPEDEIRAAHQALKTDGMLLIEVPDPQCLFGRLLGRWWLPWFQPQHQHLLSTNNLKKVLQSHGFEPVEWHTGSAHQPVDFLFAAYMLVNRLAPADGLPWTPKLNSARSFLHRAIWLLGTPWIAAGWLLDRIISPFMTRAAHSNTYRVLARKTDASPALD